MTEIGERLARTGTEFSAVTDRATARAAETAETLGQRAQELASAAARAASEAASAEASLKADAQALADAARTASVEAEALRKATQALRGEQFLKTAAFITGHLNSMAIDITRLLNRDLSEELWRRYYKGERGLFTRKLIDQRDLDKIRGKYQEDGEFRDFTDRYIAEFERVLAGAKGVEHEELLTSAFVTADIGKVYLLLREAVGKARQ